MYRSLTISSQSTIEPINTTSVQAHLKVQTTLEDSLFPGWIKAARMQLENKIHRALVPTSWSMEIDDWEDTIILPNPPLSSTSGDVVITYINTSGGTSTCASTNYTVDSKIVPGRIYLAYNASWPTDIRDVEGAIKIAYKSGYTTATIPENAALWMKCRIGIMHQFREPVIEGRSITEVKRYFFDGLIDNLICHSSE